MLSCSALLVSLQQQSTHLTLNRIFFPALEVIRSK